MNLLKLAGIGYVVSCCNAAAKEMVRQGLRTTDRKKQLKVLLLHTRYYWFLDPRSIEDDGGSKRYIRVMYVGRDGGGGGSSSSRPSLGPSVRPPYVGQ